jgi:hypothetical protein
MSGEEVVQSAIANKRSLAAEAKVQRGRGKAGDVLVARAVRYLKKQPDGLAFRAKFLMSTSRYEMSAASRLVCPRDSIIDLVDNGQVPLTWLVDGCPRKSSSYTFWYNRILNRRPSVIRSKSRNRSRTHTSASVAIPAAPTFFDIKDHEFTV